MTWRTWRTWRALIACLAVLIGLTAAGTSPAFAGIDARDPDIDQHCGVNTIGSGTTTIAVPVNRLSLNFLAVGHDPAGSKITVVYTIPGTSKYGTLFGQYDPARGNAAFNYTIDNPPADSTLSISFEIAWPDGTYYSNTVTHPLLHCTRDNAGEVDKRWWQDPAHTTVFQQCTTVGKWPFLVRAVDVTVHLSHDGTGYAGLPVWTDYWIPGKKGYTTGASGTADSTGDAWQTFRLVAPPTGAELDILSTFRDPAPWTYSVHTWVPIAC
ncbi:hypothetical protein [Streptomyces sp. NPDC086787]|uniref:hypothetical protein n=1 Tax=Streptomyces sp. NPDC086787 TaxID=3365759 RepID=UPI0038059C4E